MSEKILVEKHSGEKEIFAPEKLHASLRRSGASPQLTRKVGDALTPYLEEGITTREIYRRAFQLLKKFQRSTAARYSLKKAIMELGPSGYPFEHFVGAVIEHMGYSVEVGRQVRGQCVEHEVDVVAYNDHQQFMVECKYYNRQGKQCNVKVPLYIHARFQDIEKRWKSTPGLEKRSFHGWVVTNTRFTRDAMDYGRCIGLRMVSWDYPKNESLKDMVEKTGLFPVTVLTLLNRKQKQVLLEKEIVLCSQLLEKPGILDTLGLKGNIIDKVLDESRALVEA
ncbi:MAG: restriction endonuclease [Bacteroidales bacterium]